MTDILTQFQDALTAAGYSLPNGKAIQADDRWHRLRYQDEKSSSGRYSLKMVTSDFAIASFCSEKDAAGLHKWNSKSDGRPISKEERSAMRAQADAYREERQRETEARQNRIGERLTRLLAACPPVDAHPYLERKAISSHGVKLRARKQRPHELWIPMMMADGRIVNVQRIQPNGWKGFHRGARVIGACYPIGAFPEGTGVLVICEGFATGASIHEVTGLPVRVAFNTGNLMHVAKALREKYPQARIVFAADNDLWTFVNKKAVAPPATVPGDDPRWDDWRTGGLLYNPGREKAEQAAVAIGGAVVIYPEFEKLRDKPTDFNDLRQAAGDQAITKRMAEAIVERELVPEAPGVQPPDWTTDAGEYAADNGTGQVSRWPFKILGHNEGLYYFFPRTSGQIFSSTAQGLGNLINLFRLADLDFWNDYFNHSGKLQSRKVAELAANALTQEAHEVGIFKPSNVRGAGAWMDRGRPVIHCGDHLYVEGEKIQPHRFPSRFVYPLRSADFPTDAVAMHEDDAAELRDICRQISWESMLSADLLAGWIVVAPFCGALDWRPHIWVEGESESGKSTVIDRIIRPMLEGVSLRFDGGTTEAAIRQELGVDALPVIYDEAEPENVKDRIIMDGLLLLARRASSGGRISKGGSNGSADNFNMRSCFCFAGINPAIKQRADESRISRLVIKRATGQGADQFYKDLKKRIRRTITRDYAHRMIARTLENLPTLIANCEIFTDAAADVLGSRRAADQIGPMLAGLYLLTSDQRVDYDLAVKFIRHHDWTAHTAIAEASDPERLITHICTYTVRYFSSEIPIGELIKRAHDALYSTEETPDTKPANFLRSMGIWVRNDGVMFANKSPPLERVLRDTVWVSWSRPLKDIVGSLHVEPLKFATGLNSRSVRVPLSAFGIDEVPS